MPQLKICLTSFVLGWLEIRRCFNAITFNFSIQYAFSSVHLKQEGFKLNGTRKVLVCADDVNILANKFCNSIYSPYREKTQNLE
jgi:hypothetical protein